MNLLVLVFIFIIVVVIISIKSIHGDNRLFINRSFFDEFECGFMGVHPSNPSMVYSYIIIGVFFVIFDLEVALLLGVPYQLEMYFNFLWYLVFVSLLCVGYVLEVHNGYVRWSK